MLDALELQQTAKMLVSSLSQLDRTSVVASTFCIVSEVLTNAELRTFARIGSVGECSGWQDRAHRTYRNQADDPDGDQ